MICRFATPLQSAVYGLRVIDASTGVGIPLVECKTTQQTTYWSDSAGYVVIHEPGLDGEEMFLHLRSDGYQIKADGFGYQGTRIALKPNQTSLVQINRTQPAERVERITGIGRYRDAQLLGVKPYIDWQEPSADRRPGFQPGRCFWAKNLLVLVGYLHPSLAFRQFSDDGCHES